MRSLGRFFVLLLVASLACVVGMGEPVEIEDRDDAGITNGKDFAGLTVGVLGSTADLAGLQLDLTARFYASKELTEFLIYIDYDHDTAADLSVRCLANRFEVYGESSPGLFSNLLFVGTPAATGRMESFLTAQRSYRLLLPWQTLFANCDTVYVWLYAQDGSDRVPDVGACRVAWTGECYAMDTDKDQDGLNDDYEQRTLDRYAPYYHFTSGEDYPPCDAIWYVRHSSLKAEADENAASVIERDILSVEPSLILRATEVGDNLGLSELALNPQRTRYCLNVGNEYRDGYDDGDGYDWSDILALGNVGLYGHVVPYGDLVKVEYWQFYGYSDTHGPLDIGDHEADWEGVALLLDPVTGWLVKAFHYVHGKEIAFDFTVPGVDRFFPADTWMEFRGPNYDTSGFNVANGVERACNNLVRFQKDPTTGEFTHIVVFVEEDSHASWPSEYWSYSVSAAGSDWGAPGHGGGGNAYQARNVPNLGEVDHLLSGDANIILRYNGRWGAYRGQAADEAGNDTPPGPALHWEWVWPSDSVIWPKIPDESFVDGGSMFR